MRRISLIAAALLSTAAVAEDGQFDHDSATARALARSMMVGEPTAERQIATLQAARAAAAAAPSADAWVNVGPSDGVQISPVVGGVDSGRVRKIVPHPTDANILYVATAGGGVWKTYSAQATIGTSSGPRWFSITDNLGSTSVGALALDPNSPDTLYLGLGDPFDVHTPGFFTSLDGGVTWSDMEVLSGSNGTATSVRDIVVDPANTGVVLIATDAGVFKITDRTGKPAYLDQFGGHSDCWSIASVGPSYWLVTCSGHVYRSVDNAASFGEITAGLTSDAGDLGRMTLAAAPSDRASPQTARVYLLAANLYGSDQKDVFYSNSGGAQWFSLNMVPESVCGVNCPIFTNAGSQPDLDLLHDQAWYNQAILVDPDDRNTVFIGGNLNIARSKDGGQTWALMGDWLPNNTQGTGYLSYVHADHHAMAVQKATIASPKYFYSGNDGGLFRSSNIFAAAAPTNANPRTVTFEDRVNRGIVSHLVYSVATDIHDSSNTKMLGGLQDNGTRMRIVQGDGTGTLFDEMIGADGFGVGLGKSGSSAAWGSLLIGTVYGTIWRSTDSGSNFAVSMNGICQARAITEAFGSACDVDGGTNFYMKMASDQADSSGQVFVTVINNSTCDPGQTSCTVPGNNTVYASTNGGGTWVNSNGSMGASFPDYLRFVGTNPLHARHWTVADYAHVYVSTDSGAHWTASASLPDGVNAAAFEGSTGAIVWAVAGSKVYRSTNAGGAWSDMTSDLPDVPINTVAVNPANLSQIWLGTQIGLYRSDNGGAHWLRAGAGSLPLVSVTEISVTLDGAAVRISTYGRGFWELNGSATAPAGVHGNGDFDHNQILDGFDVVRAAVSLGTTPADSDYSQVGNLTGSTNAIDASDIDLLVARLGGRP